VAAKQQLIVKKIAVFLFIKVHRSLPIWGVFAFDSNHFMMKLPDNGLAFFDLTANL
jgi:hypothetical protein